VVEKPIAAKELPFEFMLKALRLVNGVPTMRFEERTGLPLAAVARRLAAAAEQGLLEREPARIRPTRRGRLFLNELLQVFLD
jgi:oxygen-independent coproporphyrinogen-3 oxidase